MILDKDENIENTKPEGEAKEDGQYGKLNQQCQNHLKVIIPETITKKIKWGRSKLETTHLKLRQAGLKTLPNWHNSGSKNIWLSLQKLFFFELKNISLG